MSKHTSDQGRGPFEEASILAQAGNEDPRLGDFLAHVEGSFGQLPPEPVVSEHLAAVMAAMTAGRSVPERSWLSKRRFGVVLVAATMALSVLLVGFSYAGLLTFPEPVRNALSWFGLDAPSPHKDRTDKPETKSPDAPNSAVRPSGRPTGGGPPVVQPGRGDRPDQANGDHPEGPGGQGGDRPDPGKGDRPDRSPTPCPFPYNILGCPESGP